MKGDTMEQETATRIIAESAELREKHALRVMTVQDAIDEALWLRRTPDGILSPDVAKQTIATLHAALEASRCYYNAVRRRQQTFVLVEQDRAAPAAIAAWAATARAHGCPAEKVENAFRVAQEWRSRPEHATKWPD
jgi:hypothetical protein